MPKKDEPVHLAELGRSPQSKARCEKLRKVKEAINPQNEVENLYAEDCAETSLYKMDLNCAVQRRIVSLMPEALYNLLCRHNITQDEQDLERLVYRWAKGDPDARREVATWLAQYQMTETDIEAEAVLLCLPTIHAVDALQTAASARRDKALAGVVFWRQQMERQRLAYGSADVLKQAKDDE